MRDAHSGSTQPTTQHTAVADSQPVGVFLSLLDIALIPSALLASLSLSHLSFDVFEYMHRSAVTCGMQHASHGLITIPISCASTSHSVSFPCRSVVQVRSA